MSDSHGEFSGIHGTPYYIFSYSFEIMLLFTKCYMFSDLNSYVSVYKPDAAVQNSIKPTCVVL